MNLQCQFEFRKLCVANLQIDNRLESILQNAIPSDEVSSPGDQHCGPVARPQFQLRSLPIPFRWEVTRRHPYYLTCWKTARRHIRREPIQDPREHVMGPAACAVLTAIGVTGEPVDPATPFAELGEDDLHQAWLSGVVHPITCRGLAGLLLAVLPKETLGTLGYLFTVAACDDRDDKMPQLVEAFQTLQQSDKPGLDSFVNEPIVSVNPVASAKQITEAIGELLHDWKAERDLSERRIRSDKFPQYLQVWDLREGWTGSDYDPLAEKTFREIAKVIGETPSTVSNHYRRAFELITGHAYRPGLWYRIIMWHKVFLLNFENSLVSRRRPSKSPTQAPVPVSRLGADLDVVGSSICSNDNSHSQELIDLMIDIGNLIQEGKSDHQIMGSLEMIDNAVSRRIIEYSRRRDELG